MENETIMQQQPQKIAVSSQLMQNYRLASPFVAGGRIATAFDSAAHQTEVLSVGGNGKVYSLYVDEASDTGWSDADLALPAKEATMLAACNRMDGTMVVYVVDDQQRICSNEKAPGGTWQGWTVPAFPFDLIVFHEHGNQHFGKILSIIDLKVFYVPNPQRPTTLDIKIAVLCNVQMDDGQRQIPLTNMLSDPRSGEWLVDDPFSNARDWCPASVNLPDQGWANGVYMTGNLADENGPAGVGLQSYSSTMSSPLIRMLDSTGSNWSGYRSLSVAGNSDGSPPGYDELFAILAPQGVAGPATHLRQIETSTNQGIFEPHVLSGSIKVMAIAPRTAPLGRIELFAVGEDKALYHVRQLDEDPTQWSDFLRLELSEDFVQVIPGRNATLYSEVFAVSAGGNLLHIWQADAADDWHFDQVETENPWTAKLEEVATYTMQMTVFDAQDVPAPGTAVRIYSDTPVVLDVNGVTCLVEAGAPWDCGSLANGNVTISMRVEGLGMPLLKAWTAFMPENDRVLLDASAPVRDRLQQIDADQLNAAQVTDDQGRQTPLLNATARQATPSLVQMLHASMQAAAQVEASQTLAADMVHFHRLTDHRVARYQVAGAPQMMADTSTLPVWSLDFTSGLPVFTALSAEQADQIRAAQRQLPDIATLTTQSSSPFDWGSVFAALEDGFFGLAPGQSIFVDGLKVSINLIVEGVTYVYHAVINFVEQVFDVVEEVFQAVGVAFDQLFHWLGHIFGWNDILRSQEAIEHLWDQVQQFLRTGILKVRSVAEPGGLIDGYKIAVSTQFDDFLKTILPPDEQFGSLCPDSSTPPTPAELALHQSAGINVFLDGLMHATAGTTTPVAWLALPHTAALTAAVDDLSSALASTSQSFQASDAFKSALVYFETIPDHPDQFLQLIAAAVVKIVEGITLFALDAAAAVITSLCNAVLAVLDEVWNLLHEPWDVPLLSALYASYTNGKTLTTINLLALLVATPATVLYKLVNGKSTFPDNDPSAAPFPDQASLDAFKSTVTVQWLLQQAGLANSVSGSAQAVSLEVNPVLLIARRFCRACYAINSLVYVATDFIIDLTAQPNPENYWKGWKPDPTTFSRLALMHAWLEPILSIPWLMGSQGSFGCDDSEEFGNLVWLLQWIGVALDTVAYWREGKVTRESYGNAGVWIHSLRGAVKLGLRITKAVKVGGADRAGSALEVLNTIPQPLKWMSKYPGRTTPVGAIMCLALLGLDVVCDLSATGIAIAEVFTSENDGSAGISEASAAIQ